MLVCIAYAVYIHVHLHFKNQNRFVLVWFKCWHIIVTSFLFNMMDYVCFCVQTLIENYEALLNMQVSELSDGSRLETAAKAGIFLNQPRSFEINFGLRVIELCNLWKVWISCNKAYGSNFSVACCRFAHCPTTRRMQVWCLLAAFHGILQLTRLTGFGEIWTAACSSTTDVIQWGYSITWTELWCTEMNWFSELDCVICGQLKSWEARLTWGCADW